MSSAVSLWLTTVHARHISQGHSSKGAAFGVGRSLGSHAGQDLTTKRNHPAPPAIGEESEATNAEKAARKDMQ